LIIKKEKGQKLDFWAFALFLRSGGKFITFEKEF
jgi:hypothetical protein